MANENEWANIEWVRIKRRKLTTSERSDLDLLDAYDDVDVFAYDCKLPEDDQVVLLTIRLKNGDLCVATDTFCVDEYGSYFEDWDECDSAEIIAWAPMPEPFKP